MQEYLVTDLQTEQALVHHALSVPWQASGSAENMELKIYVKTKGNGSFQNYLFKKSFARNTDV